ncbi:MAG TPA: tryptophan synthase subunit alpha [Candidatus Hydrogenedentes bacterium]|nr:tryptophan synthase subunit alpha [Candidatus Hydrogenedentota bacterium]HNT88518.1 tryptophan synthase subunit alpha [Candidatus Hydrogenedentota bacterium]
MNRIIQRFAELKARGETAFIPYITGGDPTLARTEEIILALAEAGSDVIELGVPFSDPVGDGPVIAEAALRALNGGATLDRILELVARVRRRTEVPILLFTYYNPVLVYGAPRFARDVAAAGADGALCVDLPAEEADEYKATLDAAGLCTVFLVAPTTTEERLDRIVAKCSGFVYYVSRLGVTGAREDLAADLREAVARIKRHTDKPVAVGFGISTPEQAAAVAGLADGVIVGSAIVRLIAQLGDTPETAEKVGEFAAMLVAAGKRRE